MNLSSKIETLYSRLADEVQSRALHLKISESGSATVVGDPCEATEDILLLLEEIEQFDDHFELTIQNPNGGNMIEMLTQGQTFSFEVGIVRSSNYFFGRDLADLLSTQGGKFCTSSPKKLCLVDDRWRSWEHAKSNFRQSAPVSAYIRITEFIGFLQTHVANHADTDDTNVYFFTSEGRLQIRLRYGVNYIYGQPGIILDNLHTLLTQFESELHREDKTKILKHVIREKVGNYPQDERFDAMLRDIDEIAKNYQHNHELFISGFSFEDKKEDLLAATTAFTSKLNGAIDSIHTRIIGIPLATAIPAIYIKTSKINPPEGVDFSWLLFLGSIFIIFVIGVSLYNQWQLLHKVRNEYNLKWARFKVEIPNLLQELETEHDNLERCFKLNRRLLVFFFVALFVFGLVPIEFMFSLSELIAHYARAIWLILTCS